LRKWTEDGEWNAQYPARSTQYAVRSTQHRGRMSQIGRAYLVLIAGVVIVSFSSILVRYAQSAAVPSLTIAAGRLLVAALLLSPLAWWRVGAELRNLARRDVLLAAGSGAFLAVHFAGWISSLEFTSIASSAALVSTNPLWVGLASLLLFRERLRSLTLIGMTLTLAGTILIGLSDSASSSAPNPTLGNTLALIGAAAGSGYLLIGRNLRRRVSIVAYIWLVYSAAAVVLVIWALLAGQSLFGLPPVAYLLILGLAIGPQLLGHTSFNYALSTLSATFVAVAILGEPIGSALLALLIFGETFAPLQLAGFVLLLAGIVIAARGETVR
jgi:drug/metabolite transporter (DMT)-like permease